MQARTSPQKLISLNRNAARFNLDNNHVSANEAKLGAELDAFVGDFLASRVDAETEILIGSDEVARQIDALTSGSSSAVSVAGTGEEVSEEVKKRARFLETIFTDDLSFSFSWVTSCPSLTSCRRSFDPLCFAPKNTSDFTFRLRSEIVLDRLAFRLVYGKRRQQLHGRRLCFKTSSTTLLPSMKSSFWKTRKQTSFFASAFAFRHMFVLDEETQIDKLQNTIASELLEDPRVEVALVVAR